MEQPQKACLFHGLQLKTLGNTENNCPGLLKSKQQQTNAEQGWSQSITNPPTWGEFCGVRFYSSVSRLWPKGWWNYGTMQQVLTAKSPGETPEVWERSLLLENLGEFPVYLFLFLSLFSLLTLSQGQPQLRICIAFVVGVWASKTQ